MVPDVAFAPAAEIVARVARRELTARQVVESVLERIETAQPTLNCFTQVLSDLALAQAHEIDEILRSGGDPGPLAGVPVAIKDIVDVAGVATTAAAHPGFHRQATADAPLVSRLRRAGAVLTGKTNLHEFAYGVTNINPHTGPVRNPWDLTRIPGGSSGGSAAAVAAGLCTGAIGTDTGGSIRIPAALCGVAGIKPTHGRVPVAGIVPLSWSLDHAGPLARSVEDLVLLLDVIAGTWAHPQRSLANAVRRASGVADLRIGIPRFFWERLDVEVERRAVGAVDVLRGLGARAADVAVPHVSYLGSAASVILSAEASAYHAQRVRDHPERYGEDVRTRLQRGLFLSATDYLTALKARALLTRDVVTVFDAVDVLLLPTTQVPASPIDEDPSSAARTSLAMSVELTRCTNPFNLTGLPALSVPCGFTRSGLPVGLQIVGRPDDEATVLRVGMTYERATRLWTQRPPMTGTSGQK